MMNTLTLARMRIFWECLHFLKLQIMRMYKLVATIEVWNSNSRNFEFSLRVLNQFGLVAYYKEDMTVIWGRIVISWDVKDVLLFKDIG